MDTSFSRREFLQTLASAAGVVLVAGCTGDGAATKPAKKAPTAIKNGDGTYTVKGGGQLKPGTAMGFMLPATTPANEPSPTIVFMTKQGEMRALSARCTHAGCLVIWEQTKDDYGFFCPCHGSRFDTRGQVLNGPATAPLTAYPARQQGEDAIVTVKA